MLTAQISVQVTGKQITHLQDSTCHFSSKWPTNLWSTLFQQKSCFCHQPWALHSSVFPELRAQSIKTNTLLLVTTERQI